MIKSKKLSEGTCGYGVDGKLGEEPAGPHLLRKKDMEDFLKWGLDKGWNSMTIKDYLS